MNKFLLFFLFLFITQISYANTVRDEVALRLPQNMEHREFYKEYNYESFKRIPVEMRVYSEIKSEKDVDEGENIKFITTQNVFYDNQIIIPKGSIINSKVNLVITSGMNGIPASIVFSDFESEFINKGHFSNSYEVFGQDRSLFVFPLKWALTILPPTGSLTNFIKGGHVRLKKNKIIKIYYYPEWI